MELTLPIATLIMQVLGLPGLVFIIWHFDNKRREKDQAAETDLRAKRDAEHKKEMDKAFGQIEEERKQHEKQLRDILDVYREDVRRVSRFYEDNINLVKGYERLAGELVDTVRLSTAASQSLLDWLKNRIPCYQLHTKTKENQG